MMKKYLQHHIIIELMHQRGGRNTVDKGTGEMKKESNAQID
jgi:hypothetical protein